MWHVEQQQSTLARMGLATLGGCGPVPHPSERFVGQTPRKVAGAVAAASPGQTPRQPPSMTPRQPPPEKPKGGIVGLGLNARHDPRLRGSPLIQGAEGLDLLLDGFRRRLESKGLLSGVSMQKIFKFLDLDRSGQLSKEEFRDGFEKLGLLQSDSECDMIFGFFDEDKTGTIDVGEFLNAVRGRLSDRRRAVVREAFQSLDANGDGVLSVDDVKLKYRSFAHQDARMGARSEDAVFDEFVECFDIINPDGRVTLAEFERYYEYVSALIGSDELFEATVRNAWHLSGATGGSCLRLRVSRGVDTGRQDQHFRHPVTGLGDYSNGMAQTQQEVVEIRPDLGLNRQDPRFKEAVWERLQQMGYTDVVDFEVLGRE